MLEIKIENQIPVMINTCYDGECNKYFVFVCKYILQNHNPSNSAWQSRKNTDETYFFNSRNKSKLLQSSKSGEKEYARYITTKRLSK